MRLTWSKQPNETGLASVCQSPRGAILKVNGLRVANVYSCRKSAGICAGWYWVARCDLPTATVPLKNTAGAPAATLDEAKAQCEAYVRRCLGLKAKEASNG